MPIINLPGYDIKGGQRVEIGGLTFYVVSFTWHSGDLGDPPVEVVLMTEPQWRRVFTAQVDEVPDAAA